MTQALLKEKHRNSVRTLKGHITRLRKERSVSDKFLQNRLFQSQIAFLGGMIVGVIVKGYY